MGRVQVKQATPDSFVIQSNNLARGRLSSEPTVHSLRLMMVAISKVERDLDMFNAVTLEMEELRKIFPAYSKSHNLSKPLKIAASLMMSLKAEVIASKASWRLINLVQESEFDSQRGTFTITFHSEMKPLLLKLSGSYTRFQLSAISHLNTPNQIVFFQYLRSYTHLGRVLIPIDELRSIFSLKKDQYSEFTDLRRRVLDPTIEAINERTDIEVMPRYIRRGREYTGIEFTVRFQERTPFTQHEEAVLKMLKAIGIEETLGRESIRRLSAKPVLDLIAYTQYQKDKVDRKKPVSDGPGYLARMLLDGIVVEETSAEFMTRLRRVTNEWRTHVFMEMPPNRQQELVDDFLRNQTEVVRRKFELYRTNPLHAYVAGEFVPYLAKVISPDVAQIRLSVD